MYIISDYLMGSKHKRRLKQRHNEVACKFMKRNTEVVNTR